MITNLNNLMTHLNELNNKFAQYSYGTLTKEAFNVSAIELNGNEQVMEEYPNFWKNYQEFLDTASEITRLKGIIATKNVEFKAEDGRSIQEILIDLSMARRVLGTIDELAQMNPSKSRKTETTNSYFVSKTLNFNKSEMEEYANKLREQILKDEFEINKLNSIEFEI